MKRLWIWIRLLISVSLIVFLLVTVDFGDMGERLNNSSWSFLALAFLFAILDRIIMAYKWGILLRARDIHIPLLNLTGTYLVSTFLGLFLPATIGGDAVRVVALSKEGHKTKDVLSSIVVERLLGIFALLVFVVLSIILSVFVFGQSFFTNLDRLFWLILLILALLTGAILISFNRRLLRGLSQALDRRRKPARVQKVLDKGKEVYASYIHFQDQKPALALFLLFSFVENLFPILWTYSLAQAFAMPVPLLYFFILVPIVLVLVRLPVSIDGIGIQEGAFVYFLGLIGVPQSEALLLGIASHVLAVLSVLPGGILYGFSGLSVDLTKSGNSTQLQNPNYRTETDLNTQEGDKVL